MKNTPPSAQTEIKEKLFDLIDQYFPKAKPMGVNKGRGEAMVIVAQALAMFDEALKAERTRLLSVESMKMEERELNPNGRDLQIAINNREKESRNALRQSILSEMEKGSV